MKIKTMNTISRFLLCRKIYAVFVMIMAMLITMPAMALDFESGSSALRQNEHLGLERALFREDLLTVAKAGMEFNNESPIKTLVNYPEYGEPAALMRADYYGAIAYSQSSGRFGSAWSFPSQSAAEQKALVLCNRADCKIVIWFKNACGSLARARSGAIAWSGGKDLEEAKRLASNECTRRWGSCKLICSVCSRGDVP